MEPVFAGKTTYSKELYYHELLASRQKEAPKKEKKFTLIENFGIKDAAFALVVFLAVFVASGAMELSARILQSVLCGLVSAVVLRRLNEKKNGGSKTKDQKTMYQERAEEILESTGLYGEHCDVRFFEDCFTVENPGILTEYLYEGIGWMKETEKYILIFWNRSMIIPVEKTGIYQGKRGQLGAFLEKKCDKTIEKVKLL